MHETYWYKFTCRIQKKLALEAYNTYVRVWKMKKKYVGRQEYFIQEFFFAFDFIPSTMNEIARGK